MKHLVVRLNVNFFFKDIKIILSFRSRGIRSVSIMLFRVLHLFIIIHVTCVLSCPENPVPPCTCRMIGYHACTITCMNVQNELDLVKSLRSMRDATVPIKNVEIFEASINYLPSDAFKGLIFPRLHIAGSEMVALSDSETAFEGLENCLEILLVKECLLHSGWRWQHLRKLRALTELHTMHAGLEAIDEDVKEIAHLNITNLFFTKDEISYISDTAFATFDNILTLNLKMNQIQTLKRSMFPNPALQLRQLILR